MIKVSWPTLVEIAKTIGYDSAEDNYISIKKILKANNIKLAAKAIAPGYILHFPNEQHETLFKLKYSETINIPLYYQFKKR